jgi:hypothetical protein
MVAAVAAITGTIQVISWAGQAGGSPLTVESCTMMNYLHFYAMPRTFHHGVCCLFFVLLSCHPFHVNSLLPLIVSSGRISSLSTSASLLNKRCHASGLLLAAKKKNVDTADSDDINNLSKLKKKPRIWDESFQLLK